MRCPELKESIMGSQDNKNIMISADTAFYTHTARKMKFYIKDFFSKCNQIRSFLRIWLHLLKKSLMENFIFCAVSGDQHNLGQNNVDKDTKLTHLFPIHPFSTS